MNDASVGGARAFNELYEADEEIGKHAPNQEQSLKRKLQTDQEDKGQNITRKYEFMKHENMHIMVLDRY